MAQAVTDYVLPDMLPAKQLAGRGLMDRTALPGIPYRDDVLLVWAPIRRFVEKYLRVCHEEDSEVIDDWELRDWFVQMASQEGGRLQGLNHPANIEQLSEWLAMIIFTTTVQHTVVNFGQCPFMSDARNMHGAIWAPLVNSRTPDTREVWAQKLPPWDAAILTADTVFQLSSVRENYLGDYSHVHFRDLKARKLAREFEKELEAVELEIINRDAERLLTFPFARPPHSININI